MDKLSLTSQADATQLSGWHWPTESPRAVVTIVHGLGEHSGRYIGYAKAFNDADIAVIAADLRGHGTSGGKRGRAKSRENLMGDIASMCAQSKSLYPDLPQILMGHSMGGGLALRYASDHPKAGFAGVIASAPLIKPKDKVSGLQRFIIKTVLKIKPSMTLDPGLDGSKISTIEDEATRYVTDPLVHSKLGADLAVIMVENGEWLRDHATDFSYPLLVVHSRDDQLTDFSASEAFCDSVPNSEFIAFEQCQHEIHHDIHAPEVKTAAVDFVLQKANQPARVS